MKKLILISSLLLAACGGPKLPDPKAEFPMPPPALMQPPLEMQTIQVIIENPTTQSN